MQEPRLVTARFSRRRTTPLFKGKTSRGDRVRMRAAALVGHGHVPAGTEAAQARGAARRRFPYGRRLLGVAGAGLAVR